MLHKMGQKAVSVELVGLLVVWAGAGVLTVWGMVEAHTTGTAILFAAMYGLALALVWSFACLMASHRTKVLAASGKQTIDAVAEVREATIQTVALMLSVRDELDNNVTRIPTH